MSNIRFTMKDLDGTVMPYTSFVISTSTSANAASFTTNLNGEATVTLAAVSTPYYISKRDGTTESVIAYKFFVPDTTYTLDAELLFVDMGKISKDKNDKSIAALIEAKVVAVNAANRALQVVSLLGDVSTIRNNLTNLVQVASNLTSINAVNANATSITTVAGNTTNINKVATIDTNVTTVANSQASVNTVATNIANVNTVAPHTANIGTVATNIANVSNVATNISNINAAVANSTNINSVVANAANINKVSAIDTKVDSVANNEANINTVSSGISAVNTVASNNTNINTVAGNITKVSNISGEIAKVVNVANNLSSINTANNNASKVTTVANNISNVIAVGNSIVDVSIVADGMDNLPPIIPYLANIHTIASNIAPVVAVGNNINNINEVRAMEADLEAIADNIAYLSNASAAVTQGVDAQKELFINGTDYTKNTSSFLALTYLPAKTNSVKVFFDGSYQNKDTWTRVGKTLSFVSPISANKVEVHYEIPSAFVGLSPEDTLTLQNSENAAKASEIDAQQSAGAAAVWASKANEAASQAVDGVKELFIEGLHFTKDVSTQVTISNAPAKSNTVKVFFDGAYQHSDTYVRIGNTLTFTSAIPANKVEVQYEIPSLFVALDATDNEVLENAQLFAQYQANEALVSANNSQTFANNSAQSYADTLDITTQAVDAIKQLFVAGVGFTKGVSTQLTMDFLPVKTNAVKVFFDGVYQNKNTFTRVGKIITFNEVINVDNVEIHYEVPSQFVGLDDDDNALLVAAQNAAQASANAAAASFDSFDGRYLGAKTVAPIVDNGGNALIVGCMYFNSTENKMYVRNSSNAWQLLTA